MIACHPSFLNEVVLSPIDVFKKFLVYSRWKYNMHLSSCDAFIHQLMHLFNKIHEVHQVCYLLHMKSSDWVLGTSTFTRIGKNSFRWQEPHICSQYGKEWHSKTSDKSYWNTKFKHESSSTLPIQTKGHYEALELEESTQNTVSSCTCFWASLPLCMCVPSSAQVSRR